MKTRFIIPILSVIILVSVWGCEKGESFDRETGIEVRIKSTEFVTIQIDGNIRTELLASNDSVNRYLGFVLAEGTGISFSGMHANGEVIVNLDTIKLAAGGTATYVVSEETKVPESRFCEVWPDLRECVSETGADGEVVDDKE